MWFKAQFRLLILLGVVFLYLGAGLAASQTPPRSTDCRQGYLNLLDNLSIFNKTLVAACSELIRTGSEPGRILAAAYYNRGIALIIETWPAHEQSKVEPALIDLEQAMRLDPNEGLLYTARGYLRHARADIDRAIVDYSEALRLALPQNFVLLTRSLRGNAYMAKGEYDRAIADYNETARIWAADPSNKSYSGAMLAAGDFYANRGWAWLMKGNIDRAAIDFDYSLKNAMLPEGHPFAFYGRGMVRTRRGDRAGAERDLIKALALAINVIELLERVSPATIGIKIAVRPSAPVIQYASDWNTCRDYSFDKSAARKAIAACSRVISSGRERGKALAHAYSKRASHRKFNEESDGAIADFSEAIRLDPKNADHLEGRADAWLDAKKFDRAIADYTEAIRLDPKKASRYQSRAQAWLRIDNFDRAIADYTEAIRIDPENAASHLEARANAWFGAKKHDRAIADYTEAIRLDPKNAWRYRSRARAWLDANDLDRAIADFSEAIRIDPENAAGHLDARANAWLDAKKFDRAIADYTEAIRLESTNAWRYRARARAWLKENNLDRAISDYTEAIHIEPKDADDYDERGKALLKRGDIDGALADFDAALRLEPDRPTSLFGRGLAKLRKGDKAGADTDIMAAKSKRPRVANQFANEGIQ